MISLNKKNAWITGHKGFIGSELKKGLTNFNIFNISRGDIVEKNLLISKKISLLKLKKENNLTLKNNFLFHLATNYNPKPKNLYDIKKLIQDNIIFGLNFLDSFDHKFFKKILITQSYMEHYNDNNNLYATTKKIFGDEIYKIYEKKLIKVYLYDTFGLNDNRNKIINIWLKKLLRNESINVYSRKTKINLSTDKFITSVISNIEKIKPGSYEIRSKVELTLEDLAVLLIKMTNSKSKIIFNDNKITPIKKNYENLSKYFKKSYEIKDFKKEIYEMIEVLNCV